MTPILAPRYPPVPITPRARTLLPKQFLPLLRKVIEPVLHSDETYSVTNSPLTCPAGPNHLFTLKPYYWVVDGKVERRDGQRNPCMLGLMAFGNGAERADCDLPKGQAQLESFSTSIRFLALAVNDLPDFAAQATGRAERLLRAFLIDDGTRMVPEVLYSQCIPGEETRGGDGCFVIACRYLLLVSQSLNALALSPDTLQGVHAWLQAQVKWMGTSEQGAEARAYGNNISVWYHALLYTHLSVLNADESVASAASYLDDLLSKRPTPSTLLAKELARTRPRHYVLFLLEPLFVVVNIAYSDAPPPRVISYLDTLLAFIKTVPPGAIEVEIDNDARYLAKLAWFEKMLYRLAGRPGGPELDGSPWEGGWNTAGRISWSLL